MHFNPITNPEAGRPHICLTGGWFSSYNIGDQAILLGITDSFAALGDPRFSVITANPSKVQRQYGLPAFAPKKTPLKLVSNLLSADALVFTGGTPFYDARPHMSYYAAVAKAAHLRGIPVIVFGISLRSLHSGYCRMLMRGIARCSSFLGAREDRTLAAFTKFASGDFKVHLVPDVAIQMKPCAAQEAASLLKDQGVDPAARNIAICMRDFRSDAAFQKHHYSRGYDAAALEQYHMSIREVAEHAIRRHDANVIFCPMHTVAPDDDRRVAHDVRNSVADCGIRKRIIVLEEQYGPREMKGMLGLMHANVGIRFHSLVLATSMFVPSLAVAYAHKNQAYMDYIGQSRFGCDLAQLDGAALCSQLDELLLQREEVSGQLRSRFADVHRDFQDKLAMVGTLIYKCRGASSQSIASRAKTGAELTRPRDKAA